MGTPPIGKLAKVTKVTIAAMIKNTLPRAQVSCFAIKSMMPCHQGKLEGGGDESISGEIWRDSTQYKPRMV